MPYVTVINDKAVGLWCYFWKVILRKSQHANHY